MIMVKNVSTRLFCLKIFANGLNSSGVFFLIKYCNVKFATRDEIVEHTSLVNSKIFRTILGTDIAPYFKEIYRTLDRRVNESKSEIINNHFKMVKSINVRFKFFMRKLTLQNFRGMSSEIYESI